jgi:hypothetical protein
MIPALFCRQRISANQFRRIIVPSSDLFFAKRQQYCLVTARKASEFGGLIKNFF